ncbi:MAG: secretin N-terminal domain-containing protein [Candidatus Omnitrophota bacterium]
MKNKGLAIIIWLMALFVMSCCACAQPADQYSAVRDTLDQIEGGQVLGLDDSSLMPQDVPLETAQDAALSADIAMPEPSVLSADNIENIESVNDPVTEQAQAQNPDPQQAALSLAGPNPIILDALELKDMDIADVLKLVSKKSGLNIVAGQNVRGKITIYLKDVDVRDALRIILESNDLAYIEDGGIVRVMPSKEFELTYGRKFAEKTEIKVIKLDHSNAMEVATLLNQVKSVIGKVITDEKSNTLVLMDTPQNLQAMEMLVKGVDVPIATKVFILSYAQAEDISKKISESLTKNVGTVKFDKRSNRIFVTDTPQKIQEIEKVIAAFDEKQREVMIEAKIVQIVLSDQYKMGVDWEAIVSDFHTLNLISNFDILTSTDKSGQLSIGTLSSDDYTVLLEALDTVGTTNILSSPRITALNNEEARILVGSTQPYVTTTTTTPATGPTTTAESVNFIDVGVKLYVTPTIHEDDYITMKIKPEVSSVVRFVTTSNNNSIPVVETSEAETTVMVKNGITIVIGGLMKDEKVETVNKIPLLGDLPLFGLAFRNRDQLLRKTELAIFLTPTIISGDVRTKESPDNLLQEIKKKKK